ncbi:MAG TPA: phosphoribosylamine--glycine ligase [Salinivirgaceae bacterium]|nr:phosphoribosylamine--glycine ligase [Salinivirgaceae bacterium]
MNVLILGSGGREHALAVGIQKSSLVDNLYIAPGNAGTLNHGKNVEISPLDFEEIRRFIVTNKIEMLVVGPEDPLVGGIVDYLKLQPELSDLMIIGPSKRGAQLEGSKSFAKEFMLRHKIPTAGYLSVEKFNLKQGLDYLEMLNPPYVLKADGLAAGKGVVILDQLDEAKSMLVNILNGKFGQAGERVVIEEFLHGVEVSYFVLTDGVSYVLLPEAKDYKRIGENNTGLNTGGMGSVSPVPFCTPEFSRKVEEKIIKPTIQGLQREGIDYCGFIFFGLMNCSGEPFVIEYNCRMGDPETQSVISRLENDLAGMFVAAAQKQLNSYKVITSPKTAVTVVCASHGYPENYPKGEPISGFEKVKNSFVFHAGTKLAGETVITNGGRVLAVTSLAYNIENARQLAYADCGLISWKSMYYRKDIGVDLL